ncbi:hypothetical protein [uncultured Rhodospira sp.]|mgnify:CR=1 FL=1|uniref:hypothetical protein n=1 Tax=uncultured Rhodospira sp. TaxID=1936189 RepID=UPI002622AAEF|nr:hypothetical protein [uncultured Rhodospira sp.]
MDTPAPPPHTQHDQTPTPAEPAVPPVNGCFLDRLVLIAADHGRVGDRDALARAHGITGDGFSLSTVLAVAADLGLNARHARMAWANLGLVAATLPALLIFRDGATAILDALEPARPAPAQAPDLARLRNEGEMSPDAPALLDLPQADLALFWAGDVIVVDGEGVPSG